MPCAVQGTMLQLSRSGMLPQHFSALAAPPPPLAQPAPLHPAAQQAAAAAAAAAATALPLHHPRPLVMQRAHTHAHSALERCAHTHPLKQRLQHYRSAQLSEHTGTSGDPGALVALAPPLVSERRQNGSDGNRCRFGPPSASLAPRPLPSRLTALCAGHCKLPVTTSEQHWS
jgi:hypothetical protein